MPSTKRIDRLTLDLYMSCPDLNKGMSYKAEERKMKFWIDGEYAGFFDMNTPDTVLLRGIKLRSVIIAKKVFQRSNGDQTTDEIDLIQKYVVGQNFIEVTFPKSGKVRRKKVSFKTSNHITLLQPQDFWN
jgi:hypothetical protein